MGHSKSCYDVIVWLTILAPGAVFFNGRIVFKLMKNTFNCHLIYHNKTNQKIIHYL